MITTTTRFRFALLLALPLALGVTACDNPVDDDDSHPVALVLVNAQGTEVARVRPGPNVTGGLSVSLSGPQTFSAHTLDEAGRRVEFGAATGLSLQAQITNDLATAQVAGNQLTITGRRAGTGSVGLTVQHGGHPEFSGSVPLTVTQ